MYTFQIPHDFSNHVLVMRPGEVHYHTINLGQCGFVGPGKYSIHVVASNDVKIEAFISNLSLSEREPGWTACESIQPFVVNGGVNHFHQGDFTDVAALLMFKITASALAPQEIGVSLSLCLKNNLRGKKPKPVPAPHPDFFEVVQGSTLMITKSDLLKNDESEITIVNYKIGDPVNGTLIQNGDQITFVHTGHYGEPASFTYMIQDAAGTWSRFPCLVSLTVKPLPQLEAYIFNTADLLSFADNYKPPTLKEIFNTWDRYYNRYYYPSGTPPQGEAASWEMASTTQFRCTVNSNYLTGFISPKMFDYYEHQVDLSSTDSDDDTIAVLIAFARINNHNYSLLLVRESGGMAEYTNSTGFSLLLFIDNTATPIKLPDSRVCWSGSPSSNQGSYGWNRTSPTRVKVIRSGDKIQIQSAPFKSTDLTAGASITIDLNDYPQLAWVKGPHQYGYACQSQLYSTFNNVVFSGIGASNIDQLFDATTGDVYTYQAGKWQPNGQKIWDVTSWPRQVKNPITGKVYQVTSSSVTEIP